jgi:two-component system chemotaxis sensor kinase CheA
MKRTRANSYLGKYREIVFAVAFFLVFDLAVLVLNFYISYQITGDAVAINLAGRQRMLSQRMTKSLLASQSDAQRGADDANAIAEAKQTAALFDSTLNAFQAGGEAIGGDGERVVLAAIDIEEGQAILAEARHLWQPLKGLLDALNTTGPIAAEQLEPVVTYARQNNVSLLTLMNKLTTHLERTARAKANRLRAVQTIGIVLALLNFGFILFKFIRRLRENDRRVEIAQKETAEILGTVKEGLFLLDGDFRIGSQYSASLQQILGRSVQPGEDFRTVLRAIIPAAAFKSAVDYITLLFGDRVKESLVRDLNPLTAVESTVRDGHGAMTQRYLTLQFNRVLHDGRISHLLVTVVDVTTQVALEQALAEAKQRARGEIEVMVDLLKVEPAALEHFLNDAERILFGVNDRLRSIGAALDYRHAVAATFRDVHALKGEAATLGLTMFEDLAQQFESILAGLRNKENLTGDDLLALPLPLDEFLQRIATVRDLVKRLARYHDALPSPEQDGTFADNLAKLALRIASDNGKEVEVVAELGLLRALPDPVCKELKDIAVQLTRNAAVHGIEQPGERAAATKPLAGNIHVALKPIEAGDYEFIVSNEGGLSPAQNEYEFVVRDDGRGLNPAYIRAALLSSGRYSPAQVEQLDDRQILMKIFEPGFSTSRAAGRDAGHGVGMDIVKQKIEQLGARLRISTRQGAFTQFSIRFAV